MTLTLCMGLPGSGKSTWTREQVERHPDRYKRINRDDLRDMIDNGHWSKGREKWIKQAEQRLAALYLEAGFHVIIDDCNLAPTARAMWQEFALKQGVALHIQDFTEVPLETCIERDLKRLKSVGEREIRKMYRQFIEQPVAPPVYNPELADGIICDLDGTLALLHGRNPYDAADCEQDLLNEPVADIVRSFIARAFTVIFTTGRSEKDREPTLRWLQTHGFDVSYGSSRLLYMRAEGDGRPDEVIKQEIYEQYIAGCYNIHLVLDDRSKVVNLWRRSLGLICFQVAEGDF